jgi:hypothetical protein
MPPRTAKVVMAAISAANILPPVAVLEHFHVGLGLDEREVDASGIGGDESRGVNAIALPNVGCCYPLSITTYCAIKNARLDIW